MSYETPFGMGYQTFRGEHATERCTTSSRPVTVCFKSNETGLAARGGCQQLGSPNTCEYTTGAGVTHRGTRYCCPSDWLSRSGGGETPSETPGETSGEKEAEEGWEEQFTYPAELLGQKIEQAIENVANNARRVVNAVIGQETAEEPPGGESFGPGAEAGSILQRYQTPLIVGSAVIGVGALVWYLAKAGRRPQRGMA